MAAFSALMDSWPPSGIASREFSARLIRTCSSWLRSASTSHSRSSHSTLRSISSPSVRCSSSSTLSITRRSESTSGVPDWRRENSSSRRVSSVARRDAVMIWSMSPAARVSSGSSLRTNAA